MIQTLDHDRQWFEKILLERFLRYVRIHTTSDPKEERTPSSEGQWVLARLLEKELREMGLAYVELTEHCNLLARLPASTNSRQPALMFLAHLDTAPDCNGKNVNPQVHRNYDGKPIALGHDHHLDPEKSCLLKNYIGDTVITTDGSSLLGADDKAGVAEIMTAVQYLMEHPDILHGEVEIVFTPDEEIARGTLKFPADRLHARYGFTLDGTDEGSYNAECFNAYSVELEFTGVMIHPGDARGRMVNAISMAARYQTMLPRSESPEATDGDYGFYATGEISGSMEHCHLGLFIRDFDMKQMERRIEYLKQLARTIELAFPGGKVDICVEKSYLNLKQFLSPTPELIETLEAAIRDVGLEPVASNIRGGTDGSRLSEMGFPTPNIFTGGQDLHSHHEWIGLRGMVRATKVMLNIITRWLRTGHKT